MSDKECWCEACKPNDWRTGTMRMIVCEICGNKRCPHATNHNNACSNSNEPGQKGSSWENYKVPGINKKTNYRCRFIIDASWGVMDTYVPDIASVSSGFWVNNNYQFTTGSDCDYWVPPASILYVRKENNG